MKEQCSKEYLVNNLKKALELAESDAGNSEVASAIISLFWGSKCDMGAGGLNLSILQTILDMIPVPVYYKDKDGVYLGCNNALALLYKADKSEIIGKTSFDFFSEEEAKLFTASDNVLINEKSHEMVEHKGRFSLANGKYNVINKKVILDGDGAVAGILGVIYDITEQKATEEKAWMGAALYKAMFDASPMPSIVFDDFHFIEDMNQAAVNLLGDPIAYLGADVAAIFASYHEFEEVLNSGGAAVRVKLLLADGNNSAVFAVLTEIGTMEEKQYALSLINTDIIE